jgi:hypothetical protein
MSTKEAKIIAFALQYLLSKWDDNIEYSLEDIAIDKDIEYLQRKYEGRSQQFVGHEV